MCKLVCIRIVHINQHFFLEQCMCVCVCGSASGNGSANVISLGIQLCMFLSCCSSLHSIAILWYPYMYSITSHHTVFKILSQIRLMMAQGFVFHQELDLVISAISSPVLSCITCIDDSNTCGVRVAQVVNIVKVMYWISRTFLHWTFHGRCVRLCRPHRKQFNMIRGYEDTEYSLAFKLDRFTDL